MNTNQVNQYVQVVEDAIKSVDSLSSEALACVAIYLVGVCAKLVLSNGSKRLRKFIPVSLILCVGPGVNYALFAANVTNGGDVVHTVHHVWVAKLIYGALYAFAVIAFHQTIGKRFIDKWLFTDDGQTKLWTRKDLGQDVPRPGDGIE